MLRVTLMSQGGRANRLLEEAVRAHQQDDPRLNIAEDLNWRGMSFPCKILDRLDPPGSICWPPSAQDLKPPECKVDLFPAPRPARGGTG